MPLNIDDDCAFATICDERYFPGFLQMYWSLKGAPVYLYGWALNAGQKAYLATLKNVTFIEMTEEILLVGMDEYQPMYWNKPLAFPLDGKHQRVLFMDCDCVIVGDIRPVFDAIKTGPQFFINHVSMANDPRLYDVFPVPSDALMDFSLSAGVIGIDITRDADIIGHWQHLTKTLYARDDFRVVGGYVHYFDEGLLKVVLQQRRMVDQISHDTRYNHVVGATPMAMEKGTPVVLHFAGLKNKPWLE